MPEKERERERDRDRERTWIKKSIWVCVSVGMGIFVQIATW